MKLAFLAAKNPATNLRYFSGIPHFLYLALSQETPTIPLAMPVPRPSPVQDLVRRLQRRITGFDRPWATRPGVMQQLARDTAAAARQVGADVALVVGQGSAVYWPGSPPLATFSDILYGSAAVFPDRLATYRPITAKDQAQVAAFGQQAADHARRLFITSNFALQGAIDHAGTRFASGKAVVTLVGPNLANIPAVLPARPLPPPLKLLWLGSSWPDKGGDEALAVAAGLQALGLATVLHLAGDVPAGVSGPNIVNHGFLHKGIPAEQDRLVALLAESHFLLSPTRADFLPVTLAEAAAMGLPPVTTPTGGIPEMFAPDEAILLPFNDYANNAPDLIHEVVASGRWPDLSRRVRQRYESTLNWPRIARLIVHEIVEALENRE